MSLDSTDGEPCTECSKIQPVHHRTAHRGIARRTFLALIPLTYFAIDAIPARASGASVLGIVAHQDDDLLFQSPDLLHSIQSGASVRTVYLTAGDDGMGASYWQSRESGVRAAYAAAAGVANSWTQSDAGVTGHPIPLFTLAGQTGISLAFMRLPDGNPEGTGFPSTGNVSLQMLWSGTISTITALDNSSRYTLSALEAALVQLMTSFQPSQINTLDYLGSYGDGDHSDHHTVGYLVSQSATQYNSSVGFTGYKGYPTQNLPANVSAADLTVKQNVFFTYTPFDSQVCGSVASCASTEYDLWLARQYTLAQAADTPPYVPPPVANAGAGQAVLPGGSVTLNGSASSDPNGYTPLTYQWTQTAGTAVTLSAPTSVQPTFTAPSSAGLLAFQLVVTDSKENVSSPTSVPVIVSTNTTDIARRANATASSVAPGSSASAAIDGVVGGYPGNSNAEWSTNYGGAGSWLLLTWPTAQTFDTVVLYDRPNLNDQVTGGNLTFANGTSVPVGTLPNDGSGYTVTFAPVTTTTLKLNITSVSLTTSNVGLAEIQVYNTSGTTGQPPTASAGAAQTAAVGTTVTLDGSGSTDPNGETLTYQWTQTAGTAVTLSSPTVVQPTFTAPSSAGTLTFQLVVTDSGNNVSAPATATVTVTLADLALTATATASSQNTSSGQTAAKAIDGIISGYPANSSAEWATVGGGAGSWLLLTWPTAQTFDTVVLYDRPNLNDQVTGGNLTFANGTSVPVGTLPNDGSAYTVTFAPVTTTTLKLNITSVSATTGNVGLAEIQVYNTSGATASQQPPTASAGAAQTAAVGTTVTLDGSGSTDPNGETLTYQWTQTAGTAVTLSSPTVVQPTFTAPSSAGTLTFQLVVTDSGNNVSAPATATVTVTLADLALTATATASSQNTSSGQTAAKAIDGIISGYPANSSAEWATVGGGAGSWLLLTWPTAQTFDTVVLYDRPNLNDQVTGGNLTFANGTSVPVGTLPNDGSAYTVTFAPVTTTTLKLNITSVSATTGNVGLAEIQVYNTSGATASQQPPTASAGAAQTAAVGTTVTLDGSGSTDPNGETLTYQWTQTAGTAVTLSSPTVVQPTFTAPSSAGTLTFQLVVTDSGNNVSAPATATVTVTLADLALTATATASSQNTSSGQTAAKAIDGIISGYPANSSAEWATVGGGAGSWLLLTWPTAQTFDTVVLYDRPNLNDQVTGGNLTFANGTSVPVGTLPNDGSAYTVTFAPVTTTTLKLNITSVSATTGNVGLAEIQVYNT